MKWASIVLLTVILISCGKSDQQLQEEKQLELQRKEEQLKIKNENAAKNVSLKYNAIMEWDTLELAYTYLFQRMFIEANRPISFVGEIKDIAKSDSNYILEVKKIRSYLHSYHYIALITVNPKMFFEMEKLLKSKRVKSWERAKRGCFVFEVTNIYTIDPVIGSNFEAFYDANSENTFPPTLLEYDFMESLVIFKGNLIGYHLNETVK